MWLLATVIILADTSFSSSIPDVTTLYHTDQPGKVMCHSRTNAIGVPIKDPDGHLTDGKSAFIIMDVPVDRSERYICTPVPSQLVQPAQNHCKICDNGGVCDEFLGVCACPPGFTGNFCDDACGENHFGQDCGGRCSNSQYGCRGVMLCTPHSNCSCASGFSGLSCNESCPPGKFGGDCHQQCGHCLENDCNIYTGHCPRGCKAGYYPPQCQHHYTYLLEPPTITNISIINVSISFSLMPEKLAGRGHPTFYNIQYRMHRNKSWVLESSHTLPQNETEVHYDLSGLHPTTNYQLRVVLVDQDGNFFDDDYAIPYTNFTTFCSPPECPFYNLKVTWVKEKSFAIEWEFHESDMGNCDVRYYKIFLKESQKYVELTTTNTSSIVVTDRVPNFTYWVKVQAVTDVGVAPQSSPISITTLPGAPLRVFNLQILNVSATGLEVGWKKPRHPNGHISHYIVRYKCLQLLACPLYNCSESYGEAISHTQKAALSKLLPHAQYEISVAAVTVKQGPFSRVRGVTKPAEPAAAPLPSAKPIIYSDVDSLTVTWLPVEDCFKLNGFPIGYLYSLYRVSSITTLVEEGNTSHPPVTFIRLLPNQQYEVHVRQLVTGNLYNRDKKLVIRGRTNPTVAPAPVNLQATNVTANEMTIQWEYPFIINQYDPPYFQVVVKCKEILACSLNESTICSLNKVLFTNETHIRITNLRPYTKYMVQVSAFAGKAGIHVIEDFTTAVAAPDVAVGMSPKPVKSRHLTGAVVQWMAPTNCSAVHGVLVGYLVVLSAHTQRVLEHRTNKDTFKINFTKLIPATEYEVQIQVITQTPDGDAEMIANKSIAFTFNTRPPAPGPVAELEVYARSLLTLSLRYKVPKYRYYTLDYIIVKCRPVKGQSRLQIRRVMITTCVPWPAFKCAIVDDLMPYTQYNITVQLYNSEEKDEGSSTFLTSVTAEEEPGPPSFSKVTHRTDSSLTITCGIPNLLNGVLRGFHISLVQYATYNPLQCCTDEVLVKYVVTQERSNYTLQVNDLQPSSSYVLLVKAVTITEGPSVQIIEHTLPIKPQIDTPPVVTTITNRSAHVRLTPPMKYHDGELSFFVVINSENEVNNKVDSEDELVKEIQTVIGRNAYIAMELQELHLSSVITVKVGTDMKNFGVHGAYINRYLQPNTTYSVSLVAAASYRGQHVYSNATSKPFSTTKDDGSKHLHPMPSVEIDLNKTSELARDDRFSIDLKALLHTSALNNNNTVGSIFSENNLMDDELDNLNSSYTAYTLNDEEGISEKSSDYLALDVTPLIKDSD
ncbi:phosphatidylinositol phosphatase PTPRQ [Anabrus simplex]|uniref:phosphatidylinositol phosphatase PTPRQ n=1 Tax=Anabrus simplex TaxID=316456 RepID=UPI0035A38F09